MLGDTVADRLGLGTMGGGGESVELSESSASFGLSIGEKPDEKKENIVAIGEGNQRK